MILVIQFVNRHFVQVVLHTYYKKYMKPSVEEGFTEVVERDLVPIQPSDAASEKLLNSYL